MPFVGEERIVEHAAWKTYQLFMRLLCTYGISCQGIWETTTDGKATWLLHNVTRGCFGLGGKEQYTVFSELFLLLEGTKGAHFLNQIILIPSK